MALTASYVQVYGQFPQFFEALSKGQAPERFTVQHLKDLGFSKVRLLTNNPRKIEALTEYGIDVAAREPLEIHPNPTNRRYLETKRERLGHLLNHPKLKLLAPHTNGRRRRA